jgi:ABC-type Na+ transport system ATPase subunit NatA
MAYRRKVNIVEHFQLYGMIFEMTEAATTERGEVLMQSLHLKELADKKIEELSQGDVRQRRSIPWRVATSKI